MYTGLARGKKLRPRRIEPPLAFLRREAEAVRNESERLHHAQVPGAVLEVGRAVEPVVRLGHRVFLGAEEPLHLIRRPDVELALFVIGVRIER
ncbi:hypothetical protein D3C83_38330 [compost metagenome]